MRNNLLVLLLLFLFCFCCASGQSVSPEHTLPAGEKTKTSIQTNQPFFAMGADIGWLSEMEASGRVFYDKNGIKKDCLDILKEQGVNSIRLRAWVKPHNRFCSTADLTAMAVRAQKKGFKVMIDLHYSDWWADVRSQPAPAAWKRHGFAQLLDDVYKYTYHVMDTLKKNKVFPEWVQVGNEINIGMILPEGSANNFKKLSQIISKGYQAVKAVNPNSKVIVHIAGGDNLPASKTFFDGLAANDAKFDILGFSYYPFYAGKTLLQQNPALSASLNSLISSFKKPVMIVETGYLADRPEETFNGLNDCISRVANLNSGMGLGVFYWEPQSYYSFAKHKLGAWDDVTKKPTLAMDAFLYNPRSNLLLSGDFELGIGKGPDVTGWSTLPGSNSSAVYIESGGYTRNFHLTIKQNTAYRAGIFKVLKGINNGTYRLTAWVRNSGGQSECKLYAKSAGGTKNLSLPIASNWTRVILDKIEVTDGKIEVGLYSKADAGNWCNIDNLFLQKL